MCVCGGEGLNTMQHFFGLDSNSGQTPSPSIAADAVKKKTHNPNPSFLQNFCSIIRCWTPASESSCKYFSFFQLRWVMSALGTECTGDTFPFRGTCLRQSSQEKVGQYLAFF